jgi:Skp family chaperone for outer membrane proteins
LDILALLPHAATVAVSVVGTAVSTAFLVGRRIGELEEKNKQRDAELASLKVGWRLELTGLKEELDEQKGKCDDRNEQQRERHQQFAKEANEQWNQMERTLGQIEGTLRTNFQPTRR